MELLSFFLTALIMIVFYIIYGIVYRLYLSPKLAAVTWWYEIYYDVVLSGKYIWKIQELHKEYGPIIRINPYQLHVNDPEFWDTLFTASNNNRRDRWSWWTRGAVIPKSLLGTVEQGLHRRRRASLIRSFRHRIYDGYNHFLMGESRS